MTAHSDHQDFDLDAVLTPRVASDVGVERILADFDSAPAGPPAAVSRVRRSSRSQVGNSSALKALWRHRRPSAAVFLLSVLTAVIATFLITPVYQAQARVQFEPQARRVLPFRPVADDERAMTRELRRSRETAMTMRQLVRPRDLARRTIDDLELEDVLAAQPASSIDDDDTPAALRGPRGRAMRAMIRGMRMSFVQGSRLIDFRFRAADPLLAQKVANGLAAGFIALSVENRVGKAKEATAWLDDQVAQLQQQVASAESALQRYREQHGAVAMRGRSTSARRLMDLNAAAIDARTARIEKEVLHRQLVADASDRAMAEVYPALFDASLQRQRAELESLDRQEAELSSKLGDRHPELVAIRRAIENAEAGVAAGQARVIDRVRAEYDVAVAQERELEAALARQKAEALAADRAGIELRLLEADVQAARRIYANVLRRRDQLRVSEELSIAGIRVVDPAEVPSQPVYPRLWLNLLIGVAAGLVMAHGTASGLDYWRKARCAPEDIEQRLGLAVLGALPVTKSDEFTEALNALRANLRFAVPVGRQVVVLTSAEPGEGKSTITTHLGAALARDGSRVLIVDADMRRPVQHTAFQAAAEPGLSNLLAGLATESECVVESQEAGLWLLPAGRIPPNPSELLLSERYGNLVRSLQQQYDWVLIDAPPVLAVTDPVVLAQSSSGFVFVVDSRARNMRRLQFALEQMRRAQSGAIGAVVNRSMSDTAS